MPSISGTPPAAGLSWRACTGAVRAEHGLQRRTRSAATTPPARRRVRGEPVGVGAAVEGQHALRARRRARVPAPGRCVVDPPEVKSTIASPGGSPPKAFSTIASTRSATLAPRRRASARARPRSRPGPRSSPGSVTSTQCAPPPRSTPAPLAYLVFHDQWLPSYTPTPPSSPIPPVPRRWSRLVANLSEPQRHTYAPLGVCGGRTSSVGQGGLAWHGLTALRRHKGGHRHRRCAGRRGDRHRLRRGRRRLQGARGPAQRRRHLGGPRRRAGRAGSTSRSTSSTASSPARTARPRLDVVQDGAAVATLDRTAGSRGQVIEPSPRGPGRRLRRDPGHR